MSLWFARVRLPSTGQLLQGCRQLHLSHEREKKVAVAGSGKQTSSKVMRRVAAVKDPHKLVHFVCGSNYKIEGEDVAIRPDNEYPEWLFTMDIKRPKPKSYEMTDKNSLEYWLAVEEERKIKRRYLTKLGYLGLGSTK